MPGMRPVYSTVSVSYTHLDVYKRQDYYHAYDANEPHALDVPAEGEYEVSFISPVDKDGSTYEVPKTAKVKEMCIRDSPRS